MFICGTSHAFEFLNTPLPPASLSWQCDDPVLSSSFERMFAVWNSVIDNRFTITKVDKGADVIVSYSSIGADFGQTEIHLINQQEFYYDKLNISRSISPILFSDHVMLHEIGHVLGMNHSEDTGAIMYAEAQNITTSLTLDDIIGICTLYGVAPPSTVHAHIKWKRTGFRKYAFSLPGFYPLVLNWSFGDGSADSILTPVHKYKRKGMVAVSVSFGLFHDTAFVMVK